MKSLNVLFLWHMHQPLYRSDHETFRMPWVRLHATKDYLGMVETVAESSAFRMTFNFTPVLWDQIEAFSSGAIDRELEVSLKPSASLSLSERRFILSRMFTGNPVSLINPYPRYAELFDRYSRGGEEAAHLMTEKDITDLMVWRMLSWVYPGIRDSSPFIDSLMKKGRGFSEEEKLTLISETRNLISGIISKYYNLEQLGQISVCTTPYYHPILPLIIDSESAREAANAGGRFPARFQFPEDAKWHVDAASEKHQQIFGSLPDGMWPAEGSVSQEACSLFASRNIRWIATDENIIQKSLGRSLDRNARGIPGNPDLIYQPRVLETNNGPVTIFFRDHYLSDLIGFDYQSLSREAAVQDFVGRLCSIRDASQALPVDPCIAIILDGENAWEHYSDGGFPFLKQLFESISSEPGLRLETIDGYLNKVNFMEISRFSSIKPGSWINGDFSIWIGQEEENLAWSYISDFHDALRINEERTGKRFDKAHEFLRKAQGSDSFWWFGDVHYTSEKQDFDALFRMTLIQGYEAAEMIPPKALHQPLSGGQRQNIVVKYPNNLISPRIDGDIRSYFDWFGSGSISFQSQFSAMHAGTEKIVFGQMKFGFDLENLYIRLDPGRDFEDAATNDVRVDVIFNDVSIISDISILVSRDKKILKAGIQSVEHADGSDVSESVRIAFDRVLEIGIPFKELKISSDRKLSFHIEIWVGDRMAGRIPEGIEIEFFTPTKDYDSILWRV